MLKYSQKSLPHKVLQNILKNKLISANETVIVAVSGGADSVCLFDILFKLKEKLGIKIAVCHYNHRLRGQESYNDSEFVKNLAEKFDVPFVFDRASAENLFKSENDAREARYEFFEKILKKEGSGARIALGHNADDQAETFLLRLCRGSGLRGLKCIPPRRKNFIRPLLPFSRKEIEKYLQDEKIIYRIDKTNQDKSFDRNFVRLEIIPKLLKLNPNLIKTLADTIEIINSDYSLLEKNSSDVCEKIKIYENKNQIIFDQKKWLALDPALRRLAIRNGISKVDNLEDITLKQLLEVCEVLEKGKGKKFKPLPRSLRIELLSGKIKIEKRKSQIKNS